MYGLKNHQVNRWKIQIKKGTINRKKRRNPFSPTEEEIKKVIEFRLKSEQNKAMGYKKLTYLMIDKNIVYLSESANLKILKKNELIGPNFKKNSTANKEYEHKPQYVHHHWHTDIAYVKIYDRFYYFIFILDGYSRYILHWKLLSDMTRLSVNIFIQETLEKYPLAKPMIIHDNGIQFVGQEFNTLLSNHGCINVPIRVHHPESNGKAERFIGLTRQEALRPNSPVYYQACINVINKFIEHYNNERLHAGIHYLTPQAVFNGDAEKILTNRKEKLKQARKNRYNQNKLLQEKAAS